MADKAPRSRRVQSNEDLSPKVRASFLASDRTYGARRVWHDLLADGLSCGLHRIERLMRLQALKARPRRRPLPLDLGERQAAAVARVRTLLRRLWPVGGLIGSVITGLLYEQSRLALVLFAIAAQLVSVPIFIFANRLRR